MRVPKVLSILSAIWLVAACGLRAAEVLTDAQRSIDCVEDLQLPRYGPSGGPGDRTGPILVKIVPDSDGSPRSVSIQGGSASAAAILKSWMAGSTFAHRCAGIELVFQFTFVIEGPPIEYPFSWVTFQGPNHFIIHSRTRTPRVFNLPEKTEETETKRKGGK